MKARFVLLALAAMLFCSLNGFCQDTPDISAGFSANQTYFGSDFESVDMTTGMLKINIPLLTDHSQRGALNFTYGLQPTGWGAWYPYCDTGLCFWTSGGQYGDALPGLVPVMENALSGPYGETSENMVMESVGSWHYLFELSGTASYSESYDGSGVQVPNTCSLGDTCVANRYGLQFVNNVIGDSNQAFVQDSNGNQLTMTDSGGSSNAIFGMDTTDADGQFSIGNAWTMTDTLGRSWSFAQASSTSGCPAAVSATTAMIWTTPGFSSSSRQFEFCYSSITIQTALPTFLAILHIKLPRH